MQDSILYHQNKEQIYDSYWPELIKHKGLQQEACKQLSYHEPQKAFNFSGVRVRIPNIHEIHFISSHSKGYHH